MKKELTYSQRETLKKKALHQLARDVCGTQKIEGFEYNEADNTGVDGLHWLATIKRPYNGQILVLNDEPRHQDNPTHINVDGHRSTDELNGGAYYNYEKLPNSINISRKKTPEKIADEINKRYMDAYDANFQVAIDNQRIANQKRQKIQDHLQGVQAVLDPETLLYLQGLEYGSNFGRCRDSYLELVSITESDYSAPSGDIKLAYRQDDESPIRYDLDLKNVGIVDVNKIAEILKPRRMGAIAERDNQKSITISKFQKELDTNSHIIKRREFTTRKAEAHKQTYENPYEWPRD